MHKLEAPLLCLMACLAIAACGGDGVGSDEEARRAYLGLNKAIAKSITLGFQGFNAAQSANIDPQVAEGDKAGTLTITGQVDQGSSANKGMRLDIRMAGYDDGDVAVDKDGKKIHIVYETDPDPAKQPHLAMQLKKIPDGTLDGTLAASSGGTGVFHLSGDLKGDVTLDLTITGSLMPGDNGTVVRAPGTTHVTGTATNSDGGTYTVDLTI